MRGRDKPKGVDMQIVKIKNKYMFESKKGEREHYYLKYYDRKTKETRLIEMTHLYEIPSETRIKKKKKFLMEAKFKDLYLPSGINNSYYTTDILGDKLPYKSKIYKTIGTIPRKTAQRIIVFANKKRR